VLALMHTSVMAFCARYLAPAAVAGRRVVEVGACDVNGSARSLVVGAASYLGVDIRPGPGVDVVMAGENLPPACADVLVCTETLEHVGDWRAFLEGLGRALVPGGLLVLTCRGPGFPRHDHPEDHWRFTVAHLGAAFARWRILELAEDPEAPGVLLAAIRPDGPPFGDLAAIEVLPAPD
jgi:SAM-dependent methyltransferase